MSVEPSDSAYRSWLSQVLLYVEISITGMNCVHLTFIQYHIVYLEHSVKDYHQSLQSLKKCSFQEYHRFLNNSLAYISIPYLVPTSSEGAKMLRKPIYMFRNGAKYRGKKAVALHKDTLCKDGWVKMRKKDNDGEVFKNESIISHSHLSFVTHAKER